MRKKLKTLVDIVIPVYNRFDLLEKCLESIPDAFVGIPYHIYIFDNGSDQCNAVNFYKGIAGRSNVTIYRNQQNLGFPIACNRSARKGKSPLLFFLNSDVILSENSGSELVKVLDDPDVAVQEHPLPE